MPLSATRTLLSGTRYALSFDGADDYIEVADSASLDVTGDEITVEALVYQTQYSDYWYEQYILGKEATDGGYWIRCGIGVPYFYAYNGSEWLGVQGSYFDLNTWTQIVGVVDGTNVKIYQNGDFIASSDWYGTITPGTANLWIGGSQAYPARLWNGLIALVRFYSRALSESEVRWNFYHRDNPVRNGLVLWLHWDSIDVDAGVWRDKTVFGNDGTIYGATLAEPIRAKARALSPVRTLSPAR